MLSQVLLQQKNKAIKLGETSRADDSNWGKEGLQSSHILCEQCIYELYYVKGLVNKWHYIELLYSALLMHNSIYLTHVLVVSERSPSRTHSTQYQSSTIQFNFYDEANVDLITLLRMFMNHKIKTLQPYSSGAFWQKEDFSFHLMVWEMFSG